MSSIMLGTTTLAGSSKMLQLAVRGRQLPAFARATALVDRRHLRTGQPLRVLRSPLPDVTIPEMPITPFVFKDYKSYPDRPALVNGVTGQTYSFAKAHDAVYRIGSGLARHGVKKGDVVMIVSENSVEYILTFHAILTLGATVTMANPVYLTNDLLNQVKDSSTSYMIASERCASKSLDVQRGSQGQVKKVFAFGKEEGCIPFSTLLEDDGTAHPGDVPIDVRTQVALLPYSSGTTGMPKGVMLSHYAQVANSMQSDHRDIFKLRDEAVVLGVLPFYHIFSIMANFMSALSWGQTSVIIPGFDPRLFLEVIPKFKVNMTFLVPPIIMFLNKHPMAAKADLKSLVQVVSGAAPLGKEMVEEFHHKQPQCTVGQGYGLTETSPVITANLVRSCEGKAAASGVPVANTELKIVDTTTGEEYVPGEHGEVCMRGPQMMLGYLNNPKATADMIDKDGWLHTGDIGYFDEENHLYISDRLKELIKYKGLQVPPAELEAILCTHPAVADAGVVGIPDADGGEVPKAFIALKRDATASAKELEKFLAARVVSYKRLRGGVEFMAEIPRSPAGKILRKQLRLIAREPNVDPHVFSAAMMLDE